MEDKSHSIHRLKVDSAGRVLLPVGMRNRHHIRQGDEVVAEEDESGIHIKPYRQVLREVQEFFARLAPPGVSMVDELLQERRDEAARE